MDSPTHFALFFGAALLLAVTPGPGLAYVVARTAAGGRAEGLASSAGTGLGGLVHVLAAALGLSALLAQSAEAFMVLKWIGAAYLVYLGVRTLRTASVDALPPPAAGVAPPRAHGVRRALREGVVVEALNVKTALFFLAFIPQFVSAAGAAWWQFVLLGSVCVLLNTLADVVAVFAATRLLQSRAARRGRALWLNRAAGGTLIGLGLLVAWRSREQG